jgi:hypothetical protein
MWHGSNLKFWVHCILPSLQGQRANGAHKVCEVSHCIVLHSYMLSTSYTPCCMLDEHTPGLKQAAGWVVSTQQQ